MPTTSPFATDDAAPARERLPAGVASSPFGAAPGGPALPNYQNRLLGAENELKDAADKYGAQSFNQHWQDLTKGIDPNDNTSVEKFAKQYGGVNRGNVQVHVDGTGTHYTSMTNEQLLQAARSRYQPQWQQTSLIQDPTYNAILNGQHASVQHIVGRRLGMTPFDTAQNEAGVQMAQNTAAAVPIYAGAAADRGKGELATGQGNLAAGEGKLAEGQAQQTTAESLAKNVHPFQGQDYASQAQLNNANAAHVTAMTPFDTAHEQAETNVIPKLAENAVNDRQAQRDYRQSETNVNNARAKHLQDPWDTGEEETAPSPATQPAAPAPAPAAATQPAGGKPAAPAAVAGAQLKANPDGTFTHPSGARYKKVQGGYQRIK